MNRSLSLKHVSNPVRMLQNLAVALMTTTAIAACSSSDDKNDGMTGENVSFLGDTVVVANTFEDATLTSEAQTIYGLSAPTAVSDPEVELPNYINFYDVDVAANSVTLTLVNNTDAADLVLPEGRYDRYYIGFSSNAVTTATLNDTDELNEFATVSVLPAGFSLDAVDLFSTGIPLPVDFAQGGLLIELGAGTDLTNLGRKVTVTIN